MLRNPCNRHLDPMLPDLERPALIAPIRHRVRLDGRHFRRLTAAHGWGNDGLQHKVGTVCAIWRLGRARRAERNLDLRPPKSDLGQCPTCRQPTGSRRCDVRIRWRIGHLRPLRWMARKCGRYVHPTRGYLDVLFDESHLVGGATCPFPLRPIRLTGCVRSSSRRGLPLRRVQRNDVPQ